MTKKEINTIYKMIERYHNQYLKVHGIKLPALKDSQGRYVKKALVLVYLAQGYPNTRAVHKDELTEFVRKYTKTNDVQQARHLGKQDGWNIDTGTRSKNGELKDGEYKLISLETTFPGYFRKMQTVSVTDEIWEEIKKRYGYRCACCGSTEGEFNIYSPTAKTVLQKGHMNPYKDLTADNTIPQCSLCNQPDKNYWIYDFHGRVVAVADPLVIEKSPVDVQHKIYELLKAKFEK